jgi:TonB family protein
LTSGADRSRTSAGIALCISAAAHIVLLSAATILLRVPQIPRQATPETLSVVSISEIINQDVSPGAPKAAPVIRSTSARAASSSTATSPPEAAPRTVPEPEAPGAASTADSGPAKGNAEATGAGTASGAAPGNGPAAQQTASPAVQEDFLSQDKVTDVPVIPDGEVRARIDYPPLAARQGIEAVVYLELYIDEQGLVRRVNVLKDPGYGFAEAAVRAISGVTCTPAKAGGHTVAVRYRFAVRFSLN